MNSELYNIFINQTNCRDCNNTLDTYSSINKPCFYCKKYSITKDTTNNRVEECREIPEIEMSLTYVSDEDVTYIHLLFDGGYKNGVDKWLDNKSILGKVSGRQLYSRDIITICQNIKIMS